MSGQILLVEDVDTDAELSIVALRRAKIANPVVRVRNGAEALDYLYARGEFKGRDAGDLPAVVLLDLRMPGLDGHEVLKVVRADARLTTLPIVVLLGSPGEARSLADRDDPAACFACKPLDREQLLAAARNLRLFWLIVTEAPIAPAQPVIRL